jgi:hypothetical protein
MMLPGIHVFLIAAFARQSRRHQNENQAFAHGKFGEQIEHPSTTRVAVGSHPAMLISGVPQQWGIPCQMGLGA